MSRVASEAVEKTLRRIGISVQKASTKGKEGCKKKARQKEVLNDIPVSLFLPNGVAVHNETANAEAWKEGNVLNIGNSKFLVEENTPIVHSARIPSVIMAGFPVVPSVKLEFADMLGSQFQWFKQVAVKTEDKVGEAGSMASEVENVNESETVWTEIGDKFVYIPTVSDIGCMLKMSCKAGSSDKVAHAWFDVTAASAVAAGPGATPFDTRHLYTIKPTSDPSSFRVVSYNTLADCYLEDEVTCDVWFGYCPKYALAIDYRQQLLLKEITGYHGDVICLQECGRRLFENYLQPMMASRGYTGVVQYKTGIMPEGEAIFFKDSKFTLISQLNFVLKDSLMNDSCNKDLLEKVRAVPRVFEKLTSRTTVAQIITLHCVERPQDYVCIVNTHLYFKPNAPFIRNLQTMIVLNVLKKTMTRLDSELKEKQDRFNVAVMFCGDFNSLPGSGVVQLMADGVLPCSHSDWSLPPEEPDKALDFFEMPSYNQDINFQNCCGFPEFTTYTEGFVGVIDYIFASKKYFDVESVVPVPSREDVSLYTGLPSPVMPSDHIALVCELKWK